MRSRALAPVYQLTAGQILLAGIAVAVSAAAQTLFYVGWFA